MDIDEDNAAAEESARAKAIDEAERIRDALIAERRKTVAHIAGQSKPSKFALVKLRENQDMVSLLTEVIEAEMENI